MARKISTILNVTPRQLEDLGVFDGFIDIDSRLHIDPSLIDTCDIPEFNNARSVYNKHFSDILSLLKKANEGDSLWRTAHQKLIFKEVGNTALGYSINGTNGNAIGAKLAGNILKTASEVIKAGIEDPIIFELVGVLEEGVGADRISDMTISILFQNFASFSQRVAETLVIPTEEILINNQSFRLPVDPVTRRDIILIPKKLLRHLPLAMDWSDVDTVADYNEQLRRKVNEQLGNNWKSILSAPKKTLKKIIFENPDLLKELIEKYKKKPRSTYDFTNDPLGEIVWSELSDKAVSEFPINFGAQQGVTSENIFEVLKKICDKFGDLIENHAWYEYLYDHTGKQKPERAAQLLFYGISDAYCEANNLDLNRETNAGIGSLDFKVSKGYKAKVNVEVKYSTNPNLVHGFEKQLPAYNRAEKAEYSIFLVIQTTDKTTLIDNLRRVAQDAKNRGDKIPEIIIIDGRKKATASQL